MIAIGEGEEGPLAVVGQVPCCCCWAIAMVVAMKREETIWLTPFTNIFRLLAVTGKGAAAVSAAAVVVIGPSAPPSPA